ncbi:MAG TPA: hypothetical protein VFQ76_00775, partial [Longimicrobiaceae bacterium]|nr:hypothetical protein [Longimicrobiaceae bacterium]
MTGGEGDGGGARKKDQPSASAAERDSQRRALRELVELSTQCAADEEAIEKKHSTDLAAEAQSFERLNWAAEQRSKQQEEGIVAKAAERVTKIGGQYDAETGSIREAHEQSKRKVQGEHNPVESGIKKKYEEAVWLADAELEARQNQVRLEQKTAQDDLKKHEEEVNALEEKAQGLLKLYRHKATDMDVSLMATADGEKREPGNYAGKFEAAAAEVKKLDQLTAPRMFVGMRPFLILFVLLAIAAGVTYVMKSGEP